MVKLQIKETDLNKAKTWIIKLVEEHCKTERRVSWYADQNFKERMGMSPKLYRES